MSDEKEIQGGDEQEKPVPAEEVSVAEAPAEEEAAAESPKPSGSPLAAKAENKPVSPSSPAASVAPAKKGSSFIAWLALLLVLALAGAAAWTVQQGIQREAALHQRIESMSAELAAELAVEEVDVDGLERRLRQQIDSGVKQANEAVTRQNSQIERFGQQIRHQQERLASFSANDHQTWLRAEAQYLLRLANQRLIMARDVASAQALLESADDILQELDDPAMYDVRAAIASELAALRAVPRVDVEGIYLSLSALIEQADVLVIFQMHEPEAQPEQPPADDWQVRLQRGYEEAARKLSDYVVIRRRDVPMQALMDPQWEGLVRQNLRMLLEQAQVALLSGNQTLYTESLERSMHWVEQFYDSDEAGAKAMAREIRQLEQRTVQIVLPDLTRSLKALDKAILVSMEQGGAE